MFYGLGKALLGSARTGPAKQYGARQGYSRQILIWRET